MQIENDYDKEVYNGDIGYIGDVNPDDGELTTSFDGRTVTYRFGELDTLVPAYAATIHKSQGSDSRDKKTVLEGQCRDDRARAAHVHSEISTLRKRKFMLYVGQFLGLRFGESRS